MSYQNPRIYRNLVNDCYDSSCGNTPLNTSTNCQYPSDNIPAIILYSRLLNTREIVGSQFNPNTNSITISCNPISGETISIDKIDLQIYTLYKTQSNLKRYTNLYEMPIFDNSNSIDVDDVNIEINSKNDGYISGIFTNIQTPTHINDINGIYSDTYADTYAEILQRDTDARTCICFKVTYNYNSHIISSEITEWVLINIDRYIKSWKSKTSDAAASLKISFNHTNDSTAEKPEHSINKLTIVLSDLNDTYIPTYEDCKYPLAIANDLLEIPSGSIAGNIQNGNKFLIYDSYSAGCLYTYTTSSTTYVRSAKLKTTPSIEYVNNQFVRYIDLNGKSSTTT